MNACPEFEPTITEIIQESYLDALRALGMPEAKAVIAARRITDQLLARLGGGWVYLPRALDCTHEARQARNLLILEMHRQGHPMDTILKTFHLKRAMFYRIIGKKSIQKAQE